MKVRNRSAFFAGAESANVIRCYPVPGESDETSSGRRTGHTGFQTSQ